MIRVGDYVKIKSWKRMEKEYHLTRSGDINTSLIFTQGMKNLCGLSGYVTATYTRRGWKEIEIDNPVLNNTFYTITDQMVFKTKKPD